MSEPRLYILMRTDMDSMTSGKGMAQASHASNAFLDSVPDDITDTWRSETSQGFGTAIVLAVPSEKNMNEVVLDALENGFCAGIVHDPSYPVKDGAVTHLIPVDTCAYVFVKENTVPPESLKELRLHP